MFDSDKFLVVNPQSLNTCKRVSELFIYVEQLNQLMHFYYKNHLDYKGLIEKGLALDATGLNLY